MRRGLRWATRARLRDLALALAAAAGAYLIARYTAGLPETACRVVALAGLVVGLGRAVVEWERSGPER